MHIPKTRQTDSCDITHRNALNILSAQPHRAHEIQPLDMDLPIGIIALMIITAPLSCLGIPQLIGEAYKSYYFREARKLAREICFSKLPNQATLSSQTTLFQVCGLTIETKNILGEKIIGIGNDARHIEYFYPKSMPDWYENNASHTPEGIQTRAALFLIHEKDEGFLQELFKQNSTLPAAWRTAALHLMPDDKRQDVLSHTTDILDLLSTFEKMCDLPSASIPSFNTRLGRVFLSQDSDANQYKEKLLASMGVHILYASLDTGKEKEAFFKFARDFFKLGGKHTSSSSSSSSTGQTSLTQINTLDWDTEKQYLKTIIEDTRGYINLLKEFKTNNQLKHIEIILDHMKYQGSVDALTSMLQNDAYKEEEKHFRAAQSMLSSISLRDITNKSGVSHIKSANDDLSIEKTQGNTFVSISVKANRTSSLQWNFDGSLGDFKKFIDERICVVHIRA